MEFALSEEQRLFADSLRQLLADRVPVDALRRHAETGSGFDADLWARVMAPLALMHAATEELQEAWLPRIATGEVRFGIGISQHAGHVKAAIDAGAPTHLLVYLPDGNATIIAAEDAALRMHRSIDRTRPVTDLTFDDGHAVLLDAANAPLAAAQRVLDAGRVVLAADTLGAAQHMFDQALAFVKQREQFNRVIGSFQAVKHQFADMVTMLEPCRAMVWYAAYAQDALPNEARLTALQTKAHLGDVGRDIARMATEAHGGMGFTDLLGLHYWFKRISFNRQMLGGPEFCREEAARLQGWVT